MTKNVDTYLSSRKLKRRRAVRLAVLSVSLFLAGGIVMGAGWILFYSPLFRVDGFVLRGSERVTVEQVRDAAIAAMARPRLVDRVFGVASMLSWRAGAVTSADKFLPAAKQVAVTKNYGTHRVEFSVTERVPRGIWCYEKIESPQCYWYDEEGIVFDRAPRAEGTMLLVLHDYGSDHASLGSPVVPPKLLPNLFSIFRTLKGSGLAIEEVRVDDPGSEDVTAITSAGTRILFNLRFPADSSLVVLTSLLGHAPSGTQKASPVEYIDLRVERRAYYK